MRRALQDFCNGIHYGYPLCCSIWFALGHLLGAEWQAGRRGSVVRERELLDGGCERYSYVPCCHWKHPDWRPFRG